MSPQANGGGRPTRRRRRSAASPGRRAGSRGRTRWCGPCGVPERNTYSARSGLLLCRREPAAVGGPVGLFLGCSSSSNSSVCSRHVQVLEFVGKQEAPPAVSSPSPTELATTSRCICRFRPTRPTCSRSSAPASPVQGTLEHLTGCATVAVRLFHKPGAGCTACPRCWRSRRTAISSSYPIERTPTSGCICNSTPTTDAHTIPAALPSPARAVVLARANAALSELVAAAAKSGAPPVCGMPARAAVERSDLSKAEVVIAA